MKKIFLNEAERKAIIADKEKTIIESFTKNFNRIKRVNEENFPTNDTPIEELILKFKEFNEISDDREAIKEYIKLANLRMEEALSDDVEYHVNLWQRRLKAAQLKMNELNNKK